MVVDGKGNVLAELPIGAPGVVQTEVPVPRTAGFFPAPTFPIVCLAAMFIFGWARLKRTADPQVHIGTKTSASD
jgi:apolipoprotein N-acyltransferase